MHGSRHITPELLLRAYAQGVFPMAERRDGQALYWLSPEYRGVVPLDAFHVPRRLARTVRCDRFRVTVDKAFDAVIGACAEPAPGREQTWINDEIIALYGELYRRGFAHSVECWQDGTLAGGLYGVGLGGAFFGESMFSRTRDASKVAFVHLAARLIAGGFTLLDAQFVTEHLARFGTIAIPRAEYLNQLAKSIMKPADFRCGTPSGEGGQESEPSWPGALTLQLIARATR